jgi:hypothetical protein
LLQDAIKATSPFLDCCLHQEWQVEWNSNKEEPTVDWYRLAVDQVLEDLFWPTPGNKTCWEINPTCSKKSHLGTFQFLGHLLAKAVLDH